MNELDVYHKMSKDFLETSIDFQNLFEKSSTVSKDARKAGNELYTQKKHDQSIHKNILCQYSKSAAFANSSEDLALAYGNRSALLLHLHQYQHCLIDIDRALQITNSNKLKGKLRARKQKCLELMEKFDEEKDHEESNDKKDKQSQNEKNPLKSGKNDHALTFPSITPSPIIQSASEAITVKYDEKYGRHLIATRDIKPGEVIVAERGYVCYPMICQRFLVCSHCLSFAWSGIPCGNCAFAMYCSESCQKGAWEQYHDVECTFSQYISCMFDDNVNFVPNIIVAIRLLIIAVKKEGIDTVMKEAEICNNQLEGLMVNGKLYSDKFRCCVNLLYCLQNRKEEDVDYNLSIVARALFECNNFFGSKKTESNDATNTHLIQLRKILKKLTGIVDVNAFKYQAMVCNCKSLAKCKSECETVRGIILAPFSSLINHSCNSNVTRMFIPNGKVVMFTIAPVKEGEQLFDSYGPSLIVDREERQSHLKKAFNFTCECQPCKENWPASLNTVDLDDKQKRIIFFKIMSEFHSSFPHVSNTTILSDNESEWEYDEETVKHAAKLSELTYEYIDNNMLAALYNYTYRFYIDKAYYMLYGEKCVVPDKCS